MPEDVVEPLCCPQCGSPDALATEEMIQGSAKASFNLINGVLDVEYTGSSEVYYETSETVGVACNNCGWSHKSFSPLMTVSAYEAMVEKEDVNAGHA